MADAGWKGPIERIDEVRWRIPQDYKPGMRVPGIIFATPRLIQHILADKAPEQVANVATLPGIQRASFAMPDIHWGYGFPIGGVAAMEMEEGVVSPGGIGFDINCGVRVLRTDLTLKELEPYMDRLLDRLFVNVPSGVGSRGKLRLSRKELREVMVHGAAWAVRRGMGWAEDLERTEEQGRMEGADPDAVSPRAVERGLPQLGTLGSGNHFLELQVVERVFDDEAARILGLFEGQVVIMIHCGSRGFGHQIADDYIRRMKPRMAHYGIHVPDPQLACAPIDSPEARDYLGAMKAAANFAWANRQIIAHWVRESFREVLGQSPEDLGMHLVYDVAHNIAKIETYTVEGREKRLLVHRKGATRAFPPGHPDIPARYRKIGQPVLIPGSMGTGSYILTGTRGAMEESFGSTCHGAGRQMSRRKADRMARKMNVVESLRQQGVRIRAASRATIREEIPEAYKDLDEVVEAVVRAGLSRRVTRQRPVGVVKG